RADLAHGANGATPACGRSGHVRKCSSGSLPLVLQQLTKSLELLTIINGTIDKLVAIVDNGRGGDVSNIREKGEKARRYIVDHVEKYPDQIGQIAAEHLGISRQAVNRHLQRLTRDGALTAKGRTRNKSYALAPLVRWTHVYAVGPGLEEDAVWRLDVAPRLGHLADNVADIWQYGFSEMFNNAMDHSQGSEIVVFLTRTAAKSEILIMDNGVGIFRKIQGALGLVDERHAILELSKGKLTTAPTGHTGEGIFFTSKLFDSFDILSGGLLYGFGDAEGWLMEMAKPNEGTAIWLRLYNHTARKMDKVFLQYASEEDDYRFSKTIVPVRLAKYGEEQLISRSQAKRLLARVEVFTKVVLDFEGIEMIGPGFADEIFRVFSNQHPNIEITPIHTSSAVKRMIARAYAAKASGADQPPADGHQETAS
ncbi:MAG: STAS-like domain-containing protein, partial [Terriglobales bacterium]